MALQVAPELAISTLVIVGTVGLSYGSLRARLNGVLEDVSDLKKKINNGTFVRRHECHHCQAEHLADPEGD